MKLLCKITIILVFLFSLNAWSKPIVLITFNASKAKALQTKKVLIDNLHIPEFLIVEKKSPTPCGPQTSLLQICIDDKENVLLIKDDKSIEASKALAVFVKENPDALTQTITKTEIETQTETTKLVPAQVKDKI